MYIFDILCSPSRNCEKVIYEQSHNCESRREYHELDWGSDPNTNAVGSPLSFLGHSQLFGIFFRIRLCGSSVNMAWLQLSTDVNAESLSAALRTSLKITTTSFLLNCRGPLMRFMWVVYRNMDKIQLFVELDKLFYLISFTFSFAPICLKWS